MTIFGYESSKKGDMAFSVDLSCRPSRYADKAPDGPTVGPGGLDWSRIRLYRQSIVRLNN